MGTQFFSPLQPFCYSLYRLGWISVLWASMISASISAPLFFGLYWDLRERQLVETAFLYISYCLSIAHFRFHAFGQCSAKFIFIASSMLLYKLLQSHLGAYSTHCSSLQSVTCGNGDQTTFSCSLWFCGEYYFAHCFVHWVLSVVKISDRFTNYLLYLQLFLIYIWLCNATNYIPVYLTVNSVVHRMFQFIFSTMNLPIPTNARNGARLPLVHKKCNRNW